MSNLIVNLSSSFAGAATTVVYNFDQQFPFVLNFFKNCSPLTASPNFIGRHYFKIILVSLLAGLFCLGQEEYDGSCPPRRITNPSLDRFGLGLMIPSILMTLSYFVIDPKLSLF